MPKRADEIDKLRQELPVPKREENTPRDIKRENDKILPTITVKNIRKAA